MAIYRLGDIAPRIAANAWVADSAAVIGKVELGEEASVWFGAVLRGDNDWIRVGARSSVQDGAVLHTDRGMQLVVGAGVTIGHLAMLHACTVGDGSLIGIQAIVLNGAVIGRQCLVGAGTLVMEGQRFPDRVLIVGRPAKVLRELSDEQVALLAGAERSYVDKRRQYAGQLERIDGR